MRFMSIYKHPNTPEYEAGEPPSQQEIDAMAKLIEEFAREGVLLMTDGLLPTSTGAKVRRSGGRITVTDGPFTEAKEVIGGFAIMQADSLEHMVELTKRFLAVAGDGECEIRQMYDEPAFVAP